MSCLWVKVSREVTVFSWWCSDVESVKKLMYMCKTFATISTEGKYVNYLFFLFNIVLDDYDILLSYIWWWWPLNRRLLYVKQQMFHDTWSCIILWLCCTCQWVATRHGQKALTDEDILYLCICLYFESIWKTKQDYLYPSLTHQAFLQTQC